jgi:hypothetical protein
MSTIGELGAFLARQSKAADDLAAVPFLPVRLRKWRVRALMIAECAAAAQQHRPQPICGHC